jgi:lambda repressor-like predicted transcriptional regulator
MSPTYLIFGNVSVKERPKKNNQITMSVAPVVDYCHSPEDLISRHLKENGQSIAWLSRKVNRSRPYLHNVLRSPDPWKKRLTPELRAKINTVLKTNY